MNFIKEKYFELLLSAIIALVTYIGANELSKIKDDIATLSCDAAVTAVEVVQRDFEKNLASYSIDDMDINSPPFKSFKRVFNRFDKRLASCADGKTTQTEVSSLLAGMEHYMSKEYQQALDKFVKLDISRSVPNILIGAAKYRIASANYGSGNSKALVDQAVRHFQRAAELSKLEMDSTPTQAILARRECNPLMAAGNRDDEALLCFQSVVKRGFQNANVYYNLSAISSRNRDYKSAIEYYKHYLDNGARIQGNRNYTLQDDDFELFILKDSNYRNTFLNLTKQESQMP
jgi:tetratricopeptide (TPR) repeat protein